MELAGLISHSNALSAAFVLSMTAFLAACGGEETIDPVAGGESHFLTECVANLDCRDGFVCECGQCTYSCSDDLQCESESETAICVESVDLCGDAASESICVESQDCADDEDCQNRNFECMNGVCERVHQNRTCEATADCPGGENGNWTCIETQCVRN